MEAVYAMRAEQAKRTKRLYWNRIVIHIPAVLNTTLEQIRDYASMIASRVADLGMEKLTVYSKRPSKDGNTVENVQIDFENISGTNFTLRSRIPSGQPVKPMNQYEAKVVRARQRGTVYPYEIIKMITRSGYQLQETFPKGEFEEYDIRIDPETGSQTAVSVKGREYGGNEGNVVFGIITNYVNTHPKGIRRVLVLSDTTSDMGSLSEPECRRINAAIELAESTGLPMEWLPVSAGAKIEMESGTENLDWTARTLKRIIEFTEGGGEINIIVAGINVGAQSYWNAESTMLMHTRGLLIMTDDASMLLTGKKALDFSGSVSAEDNIGIGGLKRIMGPNGQAQLPARSLYHAYSMLLTHYALTSVAPGSKYPQRIETRDPYRRDIGKTPYEDLLGQGFSSIADIFSSRLNPERKKPFDMRQLMRALIDTDFPYLERWSELQGGETAVVWETRIGGVAAGLIGTESKTVVRIGGVPHDGPESWSGGTLYPLSSRQVARAINAFSGRLPLVLLANLSGFDGSPDSLRNLQLEYGAEIGKAVVEFEGPIVFIVTARYHGGAYVVFSKYLNPGMHSVAIEGSYASVIGGAPAAAVVFPGRVKKETYADSRIVEAQQKMARDKSVSRKEYDELFYDIYTEKQAALAAEFDSIHTVERAKRVGSIDEIVTPSALRPYVIRRLEMGMGEYSSP
jgi:acetyl-CoA carboxylase carboxyltransferase component